MLILPILSVFIIYLDICIYMELSKKIQKRVVYWQHYTAFQSIH